MPSLSPSEMPATAAHRGCCARPPPASERSWLLLAEATSFAMPLKAPRKLLNVRFTSSRRRGAPPGTPGTVALLLRPVRPSAAAAASSRTAEPSKDGRLSSCCCAPAATAAGSSPAPPPPLPAAAAELPLLLLRSATSPSSSAAMARAQHGFIKIAAAAQGAMPARSSAGQCCHDPRWAAPPPMLALQVHPEPGRHATAAPQGALIEPPQSLQFAHPSHRSSPAAAPGWAPARAPPALLLGHAGPAGCPRRPGSYGEGAPRSARAGRPGKQYQI